MTKQEILARRRAIEAENQEHRTLIDGTAKQSERYMALIIENHRKCEALRQKITANQKEFNRLGVDLLKS